MEFLPGFGLGAGGRLIKVRQLADIELFRLPAILWLRKQDSELRVTLLASVGLGVSVLFLWRATAYAGRGDLPTSLVCATVSECTKQIDTIKDPTRLAQALTDRCRALFLANPMQEAADDCDRAIVLNPSQISAYEIRAQIKKFAFVSARDPAKKQQLANDAEVDFEKLVEIGPDQVRSHLLRGEFFSLHKAVCIGAARF